MIYTRCKTCDGHQKLSTRIGPIETNPKRDVDCFTCKNKLGSTGLVAIKCNDCEELADVYIDEKTFLCLECNSARLRDECGT